MNGSEWIFLAIMGIAGLLTMAVAYLFQKFTLQQFDAQCQQEYAALRERITDLLNRLKRLQRESLHHHMPCFIVAEMETGIIVDATTETYMLLGWEPSELIGQNIDVLIPEAFRERHHEGMSRAIASRRVRPGNIAVTAFVKHKLGSEVPVNVSLSEHSKEPWRVVAQISYRSY